MIDDKACQSVNILDLGVFAKGFIVRLWTHELFVLEMCTLSNLAEILL